MRKLFRFCFLVTLFAFTSCEYDSQSDLVEVNNVQTVTYTNTVKSIIDTNCISCHNNPPVNFAPMSLLTSANVTEAIQNRDLIARISSNGADLMPQGGNRLPQTTIDLVIKWRDQGFQE